MKRLRSARTPLVARPPRLSRPTRHSPSEHPTGRRSKREVHKQRRATERSSQTTLSPAQSSLAPRFVFALVLLLAAALAWREETSLDLGFHLATGRTILERHAWPKTDPFTYTVPDHPYIDMHGLFQVVLALAHQAGGLLGIGLLRLTFVLATTTVLWITARRNGVRSPALLAFGFTLGLLVWEMRLFARPELATYLFLALELYLLRRHTEDGRARWLYAIPPLQFLWVYSHALSLFGLGVLGLYALAQLFGPTRRDRAPWIALGLSLLATALNPYGLQGLVFLWNLRTRLEAGNPFAESISELSSPFAASGKAMWPLLAFKIYFFAGVLAVLVSLRRLRLFQLGIVLVFGGLATAAVRNLGLFVVATLPIVLQAGQLGLDRVSKRYRGWPRPVSMWAAVAVLLFVIAQVINGGYYLSNRRPERFGSGISRATYPIRTVDYIEEKGIAGPIYNELNFGGYLIGRLWPRAKVFIDGRLEVMGETFYQEYLAINAGQRWNQMVQRYDPNLVLISHVAQQQMQWLFRHPDWALAEVDGVGALFLRVEPANLGLVTEAKERWDLLNRPIDLEEKPLLPRPGGSLGLFGRRDFPWETWGQGNAFYGLGLYNAAWRMYRQALLEATNDELALVTNYAAVNFRLGRREEALIWYQRLLAIDPKNRIAQERLPGLTGP